MREAIESLSLFSGAILSVGLSVSVVWLLCSKFPLKLYPLWIVVVPFAVSFCLYWTPVWLGADSSEYSAWAFLGIGEYFLVGFFPAAFLALILRKRRQRRESLS
jgi:hypothetical protein